MVFDRPRKHFPNALPWPTGLRFGHGPQNFALSEGFPSGVIVGWSTVFGSGPAGTGRMSWPTYSKLLPSSANSSSYGAGARRLIRKMLVRPLGLKFIPFWRNRPSSRHISGWSTMSPGWTTNELRGAWIYRSVDQSNLIARCRIRSHRALANTCRVPKTRHPLTLPIPSRRFPRGGTRARAPRERRRRRRPW